MTPVLFNEIPVPIEAEKDRRSSEVPVTGSAVAHYEFVRALLRYGSAPSYGFLTTARAASTAATRLQAYPHHERARVIALSGQPVPSEFDDAVLVTGSSMIGRLDSVRTALGRPEWPVSGITHALSFADGLSQVLLMLLGQFHQWDSLVCTSEAGRTALAGIFEQVAEAVRERLGVLPSFAGHLPVIPLGVDEEQFRPGDRSQAREALELPTGAVVFLYLGRLSPTFKMDPFPLLLHYSQATDRLQGTILILAGNDTYEGTPERLQQAAADFGIADRVRVLPNLSREAKNHLYAAADVFLSLADNVQETFGITLLEAMACGLPVIASDWSGYRESIVHGTTGFLAPSSLGDCAGSIGRSAAINGNPFTHWLLAQNTYIDYGRVIEYMVILAGDSHRRSAMGAEARHRVESHYTWRSVVKQHEELWCGLRSLSQSSSTRDFKHGFGSLDYERIFRGYATGVRSGDARLRLTETGRKYLGGQLRIEALDGDALWTLGGFREALSRLDLAGIEETPQCELVHLLRKHCTAPEDAIRINIARLVKYGLLAEA